MPLEKEDVIMIIEALKEAFQTKPKSSDDEPYTPDKELVAPASPFDDLTDEEILYFASPYFDELQAKKQAMAEQRKQDEVTRGEG